MERTKRLPILRTVPAMAGALAILALVAGPSLAHPALDGRSRVYEPATRWSTQLTLLAATVKDSAADDENDADELRADEDAQGEDEDPGDQGADEQDSGGGSDENDDSGDDGEGGDG